jgi:predicted hotdog family 3-hydroxylacyl-ACP dehydratase
MMRPGPLDHATIARLVPHQGTTVGSWDREGIRALALSHRDPRNPLRRDGLLPAICGLEYGLQAMALHGALVAGGEASQAPGYLSSLRGVELEAERLDDVAGPLLVTAMALASESRGFIYRLMVEGGGHLLLAGQATVILPGG